MKLSSLNARVRTIALAAGASLALAGGLALAQQPPAPAPQPNQARPLPPTHPPVPGMPSPPPGHGANPARPNFTIGPDGKPRLGGPGGPARPPTRPGKPPSRPHAAEPEEEHAGGEHHFCPGHGPEDPPPPINAWRGMLMVNNERAVKPDFLDQLLFRYENPRDPCDAKNTPPPYLASLLNFGILVYILYRFGRKPMTEALVARRTTIMTDIETAERLYDEAEGRLDAYEEKLENIQTEREEKLADYAAQGEAEKKQILADAEERRARMRRDAEFRIEQEHKTVRDVLLAEAVVAATAAAEELIKKQMSRADQDKMAADYLSSVGAALKQDGTRAATGALS